MAIKAIPYVSVTGDRKATASDSAKRINTIQGKGVNLTDNATAYRCTVVGGSMQIQVEPGEAMIGGHSIISDANELVTLTNGHATYPRIDIVALESNENTAVRNGRLVVIPGTPAASPEVPDLGETVAIKRTELYRVQVPVGAVNLASAVLTDMRAKPTGKHNHPISDVSGLQDALDSKSGTGHTHTTLGALEITSNVAEGDAQVINAFIQKTTDALPSGATLAALKTGTLVLRYVP